MGCGDGSAPGELPGCRLAPVSSPRLLYEGEYEWNGVWEVVAGGSRIGVLWGTGPFGIATYQVLDRRSGAEMARYSFPWPDYAATGGDDLLVESVVEDRGCPWRATEMTIYEGFGEGRPLAQGRMGLGVKSLALAEDRVLAGGVYDPDCGSEPDIRYPPWYEDVMRDGSGGVLRGAGDLFDGLAANTVLVAKDGHGYFLTDDALGASFPDGSHWSCRAGLNLAEFSEGAVPIRGWCLREGLGWSYGRLVAGRSALLVAWVESATVDEPWRVQALRLDESEPAEIVTDYYPSWVPFDSWGGDLAWTTAGTGFAVLAELASDGRGQRGVVLLDDVGHTSRDLIVAPLPARRTAELVGGELYAIASTTRCLDIAWSERFAPGEPGAEYPIRIWLQSFCCPR
jgi:hypothetical protein